MENKTDPPVLDPDAPLAKYWAKPVSDLAAPEPTVLGPEEKERHYVHALLVMALVSRFWNGNKKRPGRRLSMATETATGERDLCAMAHLGGNSAKVKVVVW